MPVLRSSKVKKTTSQYTNLICLYQEIHGNFSSYPRDENGMSRHLKNPEYYPAAQEVYFYTAPTGKKEIPILSVVFRDCHADKSHVIEQLKEGLETRDFSANNHSNHTLNIRGERSIREFLKENGRLNTIFIQSTTSHHGIIQRPILNAKLLAATRQQAKVYLGRILCAKFK